MIPDAIKWAMRIGSGMTPRIVEIVIISFASLKEIPKHLIYIGL